MLATRSLLAWCLVFVAETADPGNAAGRSSGGGAGSSSFTKIKEKNRLAQQRFRQKQKNMVATLKTRLTELEELVRVASSCSLCRQYQGQCSSGGYMGYHPWLDHTMAAVCGSRWYQLLARWLGITGCVAVCVCVSGLFAVLSLMDEPHGSHGKTLSVGVLHMYTRVVQRISLAD